MSLFKPGMVLDYKLTSSYERLRQKLLAEFTDRLDQPLAFWALPTDRHLPLALVSRTLRDLLSCTLNELYSTPGIGPKKIHALIVLLGRATQPVADERATGVDGEGSKATMAEKSGASERGGTGPLPSNVAAVSEPLWSQWRANVRRLHLERECLGRFAPTLESLPRALWSTPLGTYIDLSLADVRRLRTHGRKRIVAVLEVFGCLDEVASRLYEEPHLAVRLLARRMAEMDAWVCGCIARPSAATPEAMQHSLVLPLLDQIQHDLGGPSREVAATLLRQRTRNVQEAARHVGLNRGRVYEILMNLGAMMGVRWPEGQVRLVALTRLLAKSPHADRQVKLLTTATAFYFPEADPGS